MITKDNIQGDFKTLIRYLKKYQVMQDYPNLNDKVKFNKILKYRPYLHFPLDRGVILRLVSAKKQEPRNFWYRQIGDVFYLTEDSYSLEGMELIDTRGGHLSMSTEDNGLIFEIAALPINTLSRKLIY